MLVTLGLSEALCLRAGCSFSLSLVVGPLWLSVAFSDFLFRLAWPPSAVTTNYPSTTGHAMDPWAHICIHIHIHGAISGEADTAKPL